VVDETIEDGNKNVTYYYDTETLYRKARIEYGKIAAAALTYTKQQEDTEPVTRPY
jgi:hypothetical protein